MRAITIVPGSKGVREANRPEPSVREPDEVCLQILQVGICGTDREEVAGGRAQAPEGQKDLVIGHEMLGQVLETGKAVTRVKQGDYAVLTVRRGCNDCLPCKMNRSDMCRTGRYHERGIWGLDGYQTERVVDKEQYVVRVPAELSSIGVLTEPLSVTEKAIDEAWRLQFARLPDAPATLDWFVGRRCLVAGLGPVGLLAAMALRLRGAEVYGLDVVEADTARPQWLTYIGGNYIDGRKVPTERVDEEIGAMDLIFEATGIASLEFNLLDALAPDGIYVLTGIPGGDRPLNVQGAELIRQLVLQNQAMVGSVNAARDHYQMAVDDLASAHLCWPGHEQKLITHRYSHSEFAKAFVEHPADEIKAVVEWAKP
jgi:threonine dehydrogenase-like Zn-dependent dehydrogenase